LDHHASPAREAVPNPAALLTLCDAALVRLDSYVLLARQAAAALVAPGGGWDHERSTAYQHETHGLAWLATYQSALRALLGWANSLQETGEFGGLEQLILSAGFGEYLNQIAGGIAMTQGEMVRPSDLDLQDAAARIFSDPACLQLRNTGYNNSVRRRLAAFIRSGQFGHLQRGDAALDQIAENLRRFVEDRVVPDAHLWHCRNE